MARTFTLPALVEGVRAGDRRALARAITLVENGDSRAYELVRELYPGTGAAATVGITGPPGVGKSTLIGALVTRARHEGLTVGVVSVDPSSTFSRGAVLGDRIRLSDHFLDPGVFIRSMATRGRLGGLAEASLQAAILLDASGKDLVFLETVGIGQSEIEIAQVADTVLLVLMPGAGDAVQALKAGVLEIPDVIAVNKRDHPHAKTMLAEVRAMLHLGAKREWEPPIVLTEAVRGEGVDALWDAIAAHRSHLAEGGRLEERRRASLAAEVFALASARATRHLEQAVRTDPKLGALLAKVERRELDPLTAVREILEQVFRIEHPPDPDGGAPDPR
jgi:LAO/AO transport system kinase